MNITLRYMLLACLLVLSACSGAEEEDEQKSETVDVLYNRAQDFMAAKNFKEAAESFEEVERQHPYSQWAINAQVMSAYASYKAGDYSTAQLTLERFVKTHPNHKDAAYAFYLKALCFYDQITDIGRDQKMTQDAMNALNEVMQRFPDSNYARDARIKLDLTLDHLAGKEMEIGRYYQKRDDYLAAINRYRYVVDHYQTTSHTPEALLRLVESYLSLGVVDEARRYAAVLGHNFPGSRWYQDAYKLLDKKDKAKVEE